jgi:hypothetical protein
VELLTRKALVCAGRNNDEEHFFDGMIRLMNTMHTWTWTVAIMAIREAFKV